MWLLLFCSIHQKYIRTTDAIIICLTHCFQQDFVSGSSIRRKGRTAENNFSTEQEVSFSMFVSKRMYAYDQNIIIFFENLSGSN